MNIAVMKTKAEQAFSEVFERVGANLPGNDSVKKARAAAIGLFGSKGLPHRRVEEWKYTDLRASMKEAFPLVSAPAKFEAGEIESALGPELAALDAVRLVFVDGFFVEELSRFDDQRNQTYYFEPLAKRLVADKEGWLEARLADLEGAKREAVVALNTAFARDGVTLRVEGKLARPIHLVFVATSATPAATFVRNMIGIHEHAEATVIETHVGLGDAPRQTNAVAEIAVREGAQLQHIEILAEGTATTHVGTAIVDVAEGGRYRAFQLTHSTALVRNQSFVKFEGEDASIDISGAFLARGAEHIDTTLVVDHAVPHCMSRELFKGVLDDRARGVFQGKIIVRPDAQKTDGKQMSQVLMLSPDAEFDSKPELEIFADDVVCGHGTTSAELDADLLFYCRSRGIPEAEARALMIESFVGEAIEKVDNESVRAALEGIAHAWLASMKQAKVA